MTSRLNPYINFNHNARAAMEFYRDIFGGELQINTFGEYGDADASNAAEIMHSMLETPSGFTLMGSDAPPDYPYQPGGNVSISLFGPDSTDGDQLRGYWTKLSTNAAVMVPLSKQVWGDEFGMCTDQFGVIWMVNVTAD